MASIDLFETSQHRNILLEDVTEPGCGAVQANQHLIVHGDEALILDPGGQRFYPGVLAETSKRLAGARLRHLFLSHQDPDIVSSVNGWLIVTEADAHVSELWVRFVAHFGLDAGVADRLHGIPDRGTTLRLGEQELYVLPAHFLHSPGNFHLYDPVARILYTGDLGASFGQDGRRVDDFDAHVPFLDAFHRRYLPHRAVLRPWLDLVRRLDVQTIAPQHGAMLEGAGTVGRFLDWLEQLDCGVTAMDDVYRLPRALQPAPTPQSPPA